MNQSPGGKISAFDLRTRHSDWTEMMVGKWMVLENKEAQNDCLQSEIDEP